MTASEKIYFCCSCLGLLPAFRQRCISCGLSSVPCRSIMVFEKVDPGWNELLGYEISGLIG